MTDLEALIEAARAVRTQAYAPYSRFPVGAALRAEDGRIHVGANVENASYPEGLCAEAAAIAAMVAAGARRIREVVVLADSADPCPPCGGCRQRIREFATPDTVVHLCTVRGAHRTLSLDALLPESFGPKHLPE